MQTESSQLKQYRSPCLNYARGAGHVFLPWHLKRASCLQNTAPVLQDTSFKERSKAPYLFPPDHNSLKNGWNRSNQVLRLDTSSYWGVVEVLCISCCMFPLLISGLIT